jgi:hypothetical protein
MVDPEDLVDELVALLRAVPALVTAMGEDATRIYGYDDEYPQTTNLPRAIHKMASPSVMVVYAGFGIGSMGRGQPINHAVTICVRPGPDASIFDIGKLLVDGTPTGQAVAMIYLTVDTALDPMEVEGRYNRQVDAEGVEYWELNISFNEKWG